MKNKKKLLIAALLILAIVSIGSYAIYKSTATGTSGFKTAKWYIELNDEDITTNNTFTFDLKAADWTHDAVIDSDEQDLIVIAPGSYGTFGIELDASETEVDVAYTITAVVKQNDTVVDLSTINPNLSLGFYENDTLKSNPLTGSISAHGTYNGEIRIVWDAVDSTDSNSYDININDQNFVVEVTVITKQKTPNAASTILSTAQAAGQVTNIPNTDIYIFKGENPANYVTFNNEKWRIIGIYGEQLKIQRSAIISGQLYDNTMPYSYVWEDSNIKTYLNTTYYNTIRNDSARKMIDADAEWNIGTSTCYDMAYDAYTSESRTTWKGTNTNDPGIGLMASYEFLYASGGSGCDNVTGIYFDELCGTEENNWMRPSANSWTMNGQISDYVIVINSSGSLQSTGVNNSKSAAPVVFLKSSVKVTAGDGSYENSYKLQLNL